MSTEQSLTDYFSEIGLGENFTKRAKDVFHQAQNLFEFSDDSEFFVCEQLDKDKNRNVQNLWIFDGVFIYEMKDFLRKGNIDKMSSEKFTWSECNWSGTDLNEFTNDSTVRINLAFGPSSSAEMFATGNNCAHLLRIYKEKFLPLLE